MADTLDDPFPAYVLCDKYLLMELVGAGAMGRVYRARHLQTDGLVAVKIMNPELSSDRTTLRRFQQEACAASRLRHPNTIRIYDFGQTPDGLLYLVMELLSGRTLGQLLRQEGPLAPARLTRLLGPALLALDEAHHAEVIHRDFKPENIFIETLRSGEEQVKVIDFGIAKARGFGDSGITHAGAVCGTPDYMSPEQIRGEDLDARSDVYAAGVVLYELLTGSKPFEGSLLEVLTAHLSQAPEPPRRRRPDLQIPALLERICLTALNKRPQDRYPSAAELERALQAALRSLGGQTCAACGETTATEVRFCPWCGAPVGQRSPSVPQPPPGSLRWPAALIGRQEALARLRQQDQGALVILGPSGIGKSRLIEHHLAQLEQDPPVIRVQPDPSGARSPLQPIRAALAQALRIREQPVLQELDEALGVLAARGEAGTADPAGDRPGLAELFGLWEATVSAGYDVRRRECFAAIIGTLRRLPLYFVFEDVERYDTASLQILARLCEDPGAATALLSTTHLEVLGGAPKSAEPRARPAPPCAVLELGPLPPEALAGLGLPQAVLRASGGVPRDLEQALRALAEGAPELTLAGRLALLPDEALRLLEALVVAGTRAPVGLLSELAGLTDPRPALRTLTQRGLLRTSGEFVQVPSPALRDLIYERVPVERRRLLHRCCWQQFAARGAGPTVLAYHALGADPDGVPLAVLERAGDAARNAFDDEGAERWFRAAWNRARNLVAEQGAPPEVQAQAGLRLALTLRYAGRIIDAEQMLREVLALGQGEARAEADARRGLARLAYVWDQPAAARHELCAAIHAGWRAGDPQLLVELYLELAEVLARSGDPQAAERELREGIDSVTSGDGIAAEQGPVTLWRMLLRLGELLLQQSPSRHREALTIGGHALRWADKSGNPAARSRAQSFLGRVYQALGEPQLAARHHRQALEEARLVGDRRSTAELLIVMADAMQEAGRTPDLGSSVRALLQEAGSLSRQIGWTEGLQLVAEQMASMDR